MLRTFTAFILSLALGTAAFAQSTAVNGTIEGTVKDTQGSLLPGVTVTVTNIDTGDQRVVVTNESGLYRAPLLLARHLPRGGGAPGLQEVRADRHHAARRPDRGHRHSAGRRRRLRDDHRHRGRAADRHLAHRHRPLAERSGSAFVAAGRAQSLQLRAGAARRHRHRERRVRRAAPGGEWRRDAHQLPDRRQHQHGKGSRRPAPAADVGSDDPGSEGHHHRFRARVRPDDGHGVQRRDAVGHQRVSRPGQLPVPPPRVQRVPVLLRLHHDRRQLRRTGSQCDEAGNEGRYRHGLGRRSDRQEQGILLRRVGADPPRPVVELAHHRAGRNGRAARSQAAARCGAERADSEVPDPQGRHQPEQRASREHPLGAIQQRRALQQRRRHQHARARHRLPRRDGFDRRPGHQLVRREQAERAPRAVRASSSELGRELGLRHRSGDSRLRRGGLWRRHQRHRPG